ncbi:MAG TPA: glycosyltransferase [Anaerolineales bacterium]|nr:glycosyltransferase [Anaerolineales bacterium]
MSEMPRLLFITPVFPSRTGNGLSMRTRNFYEVLKETYEIHLLVLNYSFRKVLAETREAGRPENSVVVPTAPAREPGVILHRLLHKLSPSLYLSLFSVPAEWRFHPKQSMRSLPALFPGIRFDAIHIQRLFMLPLARPFLNDRLDGTVQLDLDDIESITRWRLSELHRLNEHTRHAAAMAREAVLYTAIEREHLCKFDRLFVSSDLDRDRIRRIYQCEKVETAPNAVAVPEQVPVKTGTGVFTFLFVGTLDYYPNRDAILHFCEVVLPQIRMKARQDFSVRIVGSGNAGSLAMRLRRIPEVVFEGYSEDLLRVYAEADAVIVPIRSGGGTRIKVLEAFAHRRPVISTGIGVEGIEARQGEHFLLGDSPVEFAEQCLQVMESPALRMALAANALDLVKSAYTFERFKDRISAGG